MIVGSGIYLSTAATKPVSFGQTDSVVTVVSDTLKSKGDTIIKNSENLKDSTIKTADTTYQFFKSGEASWYGSNGVKGIKQTDNYHGKRTANGEIFNTHALTAAIKIGLRKQTGLCTPGKDNVLIRVTNLSNNKSVIVRITDVGPLTPARVIDLSWAAKEMIGMGGTAKVSLEKVIIK